MSDWNRVDIAVGQRILLDMEMTTNFRFTIRFTCGADDHGEDVCDCRFTRSNVWASDARTAREMAEQEASEEGGEVIGSMQVDREPLSSPCGRRAPLKARTARA